MQREHYWYLDGLRGVAAFAVVLLHWLEGHGVQLFSSSILAVDFFFLLSGFVIQISYRNRLSTRSDLQQFAVKRVIRLYPLVLLSVAFGVLRFGLLAVAEPGSGAIDQLAPAGIAAHLLLVPSALGAAPELFPLNAPLWSLHFEMLLYGLFAVLLVRLSRRSLMTVTLFSVFGLAFWVSTRFGADPVEGLALEYPLLLSRAVASFGFGVLLARLRPRGGRIAGADQRRRRPDWRPNGFVLALPLLVFVLPTEAVPAPVVLVLVLVVFPLVIALGADVDLSSRSRRVAKFAGDLSYPMYVLHVPVMWTVSGAMKTIGFFDDPVYNGVVVVPVVIAASVVALRLFDEPVRRQLAAVHRSRVTEATL